jgi:hypothetical protein
MELNKIKQRLELALKPAEPPTLEEVLEQVSTRGVLRGPVDWVFPAWMLVRRIRGTGDHEDVSIIGRGEESFTSLQRRNEAASAGGVDASKKEADDAI